MSQRSAGQFHSWVGVFTVLILACCGVSVAGADTIYVDDDAPNDPGPGDPSISDPLEDGSPEHPFDAIQEGIDVAMNGDTVLVADGAYIGEGNKGLDFVGKAIALRSQSGADTCVIDCEGDGRAISFQNGETADALVDGFTITGGFYPHGSGGGIVCYESSPTIANCIIRGNHAGSDGGGMLCGRGSPIVRNCAIVENTAEVRGGGIGCQGFCAATIIDCTITDNASDDGGGGISCATWSDPTITGCTIARNTTNWYGGGISCYRFSNPTITNCTIVDNETNSNGGGVSCYRECSPLIANCDISRNVSRLYGGGVYSWDCDPFILNSTITRNLKCSEGGAVYCGSGTAIIAGCDLSFNRAGWHGGGVACSRGTAIILGCTINLNRAAGGGGGVVCDRGIAVISDCTISGNTTDPDGRGGGVHADESSVSLVNCAIVANSGGAEAAGGGLYCYQSSATLTNCSIAGNSAGEDGGGGVYCRAGDVTLANCILWADSPEEILESASGTVLATYSDIQGGWPGVGNISADPLFAFTDDAHLMPGSPCIDAGTEDVPGGLPLEDLDGRPRSINGDGVGESVVDMGAYEFDPDDPILTCSPLGLDFLAYVDGPTSGEGVLSIRSGGGAPLLWSALENCPWLEIEPAEGESSGEIDDVTVMVDASGLPYGTYACVLEVSGDDAVNSPRVIPITLRVGSGYPTIQMRIDDAVEGDTVLIPDNIYAGPGNTEIDFRGKAITLRSEGGPDNCIVDCEHDGRGFIFHEGEGADSVLDGLAIMNGDAGHGGAIYCFGGHPTITNCLIVGNRAANGGGVCFVGYNHATLVDCVVTENQASRSGGGVSCRSYSHPTIANCIIEANTADYRGGGLASEYDSSPRVIDCSIRANVSDHAGGGIGCDYGNAVIGDCTVMDNVTRLFGGGISCEDGTTTVLNCEITGNVVSHWDGGGIYCRGDAIILNCTISGNAASRFHGGGVHFARGNGLLANSQVTENAARYGGGVSCNGEATPSIGNCTIAGNSGRYGGGLYGAGLSDILLANSILWDNAATTAGNEIALEEPNWPATLTVLYSDVQGGETAAFIAENCTLNWGPGNIDADPLFVDPGEGDYRLAAGSPCIDAGCNWAVPSDVADLDEDGDTDEITPLDLEGEGRFFDDPDTPDTGCGHTPIVDMGAYEFGGTGPQACFGDLDNDRDVDLDDLAVLLIRYGELDACEGDLNCDGDVDLTDLAALLAAYGMSCQ